MGRGGMGVVYLAQQQKVMADQQKVIRLVALKLIRKDRLEHLSLDQRRQWLTRFCTEAKAAARISHDRVVTVYEVGSHGGNPFYSMRYVEGQSLAEKIKDGPLPNRKAALLMEQVARAVQAIHDHKVLHRDLKPHNILVDAQGRPYVTDFGLAKCADAAESLTQTGELLGSVAYMSPEQAQDSANVTEATDVYGLGATLYALLTGRPPFSGTTVVETLDQVKNREPVPPRQLNSAVDLDLNTITLRCLEKESERRPRSAAALADALQLYLEDQPIPFRPVRLTERLWRWCRRKPTLAAISAAALLLLILSSGLYVTNRINTGRLDEAQQGKKDVEGKLTGAIDEGKKAKEKEKEAKENEAKQIILKLQAEYPADMRLAGEAWHLKNYARVHELLRKHAPQPGRDDHRGLEWHYMKVYTPSLEPGGKKAAVPRTLMADAPRNTVAGAQESEAPPLLTWLKGDARLSILNPDGEFFVWHQDLEKPDKFTLHAPAEAVVLEDANWSPDGKLMASSSPDGNYYIWSVKGQLLNILRGHNGGKMSLGLNLDGGRFAWNSAGGLLAAISQDKQVTIWNTKTGDIVFNEGAPQRNPDWAQMFNAEDRSRPTWSPDGKLLAFWRLRALGSKDPPQLVLVEGTTGKELPVASKTFENPLPPGIMGGTLPKPLPLIWSPDSKHLACFLEPPFPFGTGLAPASPMEAMRQRENAKFAGTIVVLDSQTGKEVYRSPGISPSWSPYGKYLVFQRVEGDSVVHLETKKETKHPTGRVLAWSRDGKRMALFTGEMASEFKLGTPPPLGGGQVPKELLLRDGELYIIDVAEGNPVRVLKLGNPRRPKPKPKQTAGGGMIGGLPGAGQAGMPLVQGVPGAVGGIGGPGGPVGNFSPNTNATVWVVERWCPDLKWVALEKSETTVRHDPITGKEELIARSPSFPPLSIMPPAKKGERPKRSDKAGMPPGLPPPTLPGPPGSTPSVAEVYDLVEKKEPLRLPALWLTWSPDSRWVVLDNGKVWNLAARNKIADKPELAYSRFLPGGITSSESKTFSWSPDGKWLLVGTSTNKVNEATPIWQVYNTSTWKVSGVLPRNALVRWSPDSRRLLAGGRVGEPATGQFSLFEIPSPVEVKLGASPEASNLAAVAWSPDGKRIATGSGLGFVRVWDAATGAPLLKFAFDHRVVAVAWSKDGRLFAADADGFVKAWDIVTGKEVVSWKVETPPRHHPYIATALELRFSPVASRLAHEGPEAVQVWDAATGKPLSKLDAGGRILAWSPDENALAILENPKRAAINPAQMFEQNLLERRKNRNFTRTWNVLTGKEIATFYKPVDSVTPIAAAWSPDGRRLAFSTGAVIKIHDAVSGQEVLTLRQEASLLAWSLDGWRLAAHFGVRHIDWPATRLAVIIWDATPEEMEVLRKKAERAADAPVQANLKPANAVQDNESTAAAALEQLGAWIGRDEKQPGKPVVEVRLVGTKQVKDADLKHLKNFTSLQRLYLYDNQVTDSGLENIKTLQSLNTLQLSHLQITDAGLKHLKELKNLLALTLSDVHVTDAGLKELTMLQNLHLLHLQNTKVTDAGVKELKQALPKCNIMR
jgi:serine/threonine protein kinase/WD40 repeat protein